MKTMWKLAVVSAALSLVLGCSVDPTNAWDPETDPALQEVARVVGRVVLPSRDLEQRPVDLVVMQNGRLLEENGAAKVFRTRTSDDGLPAGWRDDGREDAAGSYEIPLQPGTWSVVFSADRNEEVRYDDAATPNVTLAPGETAFHTLRPLPISSDRFQGVVKGTVEGLSPGLSYVVRLVSVGGTLEERTLVKTGDAGFQFSAVVPGTSYRVRVEGDGYAPAVSPSFEVTEEHSSANPLVVAPLRLVSIGELFEVAFDDTDTEPPYVGDANVPVRLAAAQIFLQSSDEQGLHHAEIRALPAAVFDAILADEASGVETDGRWSELSSDAQLDVDLAEGVTGGADDGVHTILAQLRLCMQEECECASDAPLSECTPPLLSGIAELTVTLDTEAPALVEASVAGVVARASAAEVPLLVVNCARFDANGCPVVSGADPYAPLIEAQVNDRTGRVSGWAVTLDDEEAPTTFTQLASSPGLASFSGLSPGIAPTDGNLTLRLWGRDAANNVGLVHERTVVVDVTPIELADPAMTLTGTEPYDADGEALEIIPGDLVTVDVVTTGEAPQRWSVRRSDGPLLTGMPAGSLAVYDGPVTAFVSGLHGDNVTLEVSVEDAAGNVSTTVPRDLRVWRTGRVLGSVVLEGGGAPSDLIPALIDTAGERVLGDAFGDGTFSFGAALRGVYTLELEVPGFSTYERSGVVVQAARDTTLAPIQMMLPRGDLIGRFVLEGREGASTNSGIQVSLLNQGGTAVSGTTTLADGTYRFADVPAGTGYSVVGAFDGYVPGEFPGIAVVADVETAVNPDDEGAPVPVLLRELVGDFRLCAPTGVLDDNCDPLLWTKLATVDVGGVDLSGITDYRVATTPFPDDTTGWQALTVNGLGEFVPPQVALGGSGEGRYTVYLQLRVDESNAGDVLTAEIVYDATAPSNVQLALRKGAAALRDGFTNSTTVTATVSADAGAGDVAPLGDAFVRFANAAPATPPASTRCAHGGNCGVPLDDAQERIHSAWAFSCDAAGNCSQAPVEAEIIYDVTPPRALHGVTLTPSSPVIRTSGGVTYTRSSQFNVDINVGAARNDAGIAVLDPSGDAVADVVGYRFGVSEVPASGNGSFAFDGISFSQFSALLVASGTQSPVGPSLPGVEAPYRIYAQLQDAAGNVTVLEDNPFHFDLVLDETSPGVTFILNGGDEFTQNPVVDLDTTASALDPPITARISTDEGLFDAYTDRSYPFEPGEGTWDLGAAASDGSKTVFVRFLDAAGNVSERSDAIFLDRTPPQTLLVSCSTCSFHGGTAYTNDATRQVVLDLLATDNSGWVDLVDVTGLGAPAAYSSVLAVTLPSTTDGSQNLDVTFLDPAGNASTVTTLPIVLDRVAPVPTLTINGGAVATNSASVQLTIGASDASSPVVGMRVSNTAAYAGEIQPLTPEMSWTLPFPDTDAPKTVYLEVYDAAGNRAETAAGITLDTTPPTGSVEIALGAARTNVLTVDVTLDYTADAVSYAISQSPLAASCADAVFPGTDVSPPPTTQVTFSATETEEPEVRTVYVCTRDRAGNVALASDSIILDQDGPTGSLVLDDGAAYTLDATVSVSISAPSDTTQIKTGINTAPSCSVSTGYSTFSSPFNVTLPSTSGAHTVYACLRDAAGNAAATPLFDRIIYDRQAPVVTLALNGGADYTTSAIVTLNVIASDDLSGGDGGVSGMRIGNNTVPTSGTFEAFSGARSWTVDAPTIVESKTVCVEVQDAAGRTASACDSIALDLADPIGTVSIASGAAYSTNATVSVRLQGDGGAGHEVQYREGPLDCSTTSGWSAFDGDETVSVALSGEGFREIYACFKEPSGRTTLASDGIVVDTQTPTAPQPSSPDADAWLATAKPTFRWSSSSGADLYRLTIRNSSNTIVLGPVDVFTTEYTPTTSLPSGALTWSVVARDNAGNTSAADAAFPRPINVDVTLPTGLGSLAVVGGSPTNDPTPTLGWTAASDTQTAAASLAYTLQIGDGASFNAILLTAELENTSASASMTYTLEAPLGEGSYAWRVRVADRAGNATTVTGSTFTVDVTPPAPPAFESIASPTTSPVALNWTAVAGAASYRIQVAQNGGQSGCGTFTPVSQLTATTTYALAAPATAGCYYTARVSSLDALGNESSQASVGFLVDTVAPTFAATPVLIESGAAAVASEVVTVALNASGATQVRIRDYETANCVTPPTPTVAQLGAVTAQPYAPVVTYVLPPNNVATNTGPAPSDECKWLAVSFGDDAGNFTTPTTTQMDGILLDTLAPDAPQIATESIVSDAASITLALGQDAVDHHFSTYQIRNSALQSSWVNVTPIGGLACNSGSGAPYCSFTVNLASNRENRISVRAVDTAGTPSAEDIVIIREDSLAPTAPASITLAPSNQRIDASWAASTSTDVAGYLLYYGLSDGGCSSTTSEYDAGFAEQGTSPINVGLNTDFTLTGVPNGVEVCVGVAAYDKTQSPSAHESTLRYDDITTWTLSPSLISRLDHTKLPIASSSVVGAVAVRDGLLYVAASANGLIELDVSNEDCFAQTGATFVSCTGLFEGATVMGGPNDMVLHGGLAFVSDATDDVIHVWRVSDATAPSYVLDISVTDPVAVAASGDVLAVARSGGVTLFNLSSLYDATPTEPPVYDTITTAIDPSHDVDVQGSLLAIGAGQDSGLYDISDPTAATLQPVQCATSYNREGVLLSGKILYTGHTSDDVEICDMSTTVGGDYTALGKVATGVRWRLAAMGPYLLVTGGSGVSIIDVSERSDPTLVGKYSAAGFRSGSLATEGYRFFHTSGQNSAVDVVRVGTPTALELVRTDGTSSGGNYAIMLKDNIVANTSPTEVLHAQTDGIDIDDSTGPYLGSTLAHDAGHILGLNYSGFYLSTLTQTGSVERVLAHSFSSDADYNASTKALISSAGMLSWPWIVVVATHDFGASRRVFARSYDARDGSLVDEAVVVADLDEGSFGVQIQGIASLAWYKRNLYVLTSTFSSVDLDEGVHRVPLNPLTGVLGVSEQVHQDSGLRSLTRYGRRLYMSDTAGVTVQTLAAPASWPAASLRDFSFNSTGYGYVATFNGPYMYNPANTSQLVLVRFDYETVSPWQPSTGSIVTTYQSSFPNSVMLGGDRVYVNNGGRAMEVLRLR